MRPNPSDDELLRGYLLGEIPEGETERLEHRLLVEDELFLLAEAIEAELLAAADRGELAPAERERVLRRLGSSPQGRQRLALAHSLNQAARPAAAPVVVPFPTRTRTTGMQTFRWAALAAALVAAAGLSWHALNTPQGGGNSEPRIVQERPAPARPAVPEASRPAPVPPPAPVQRKPLRVILELALISLRGSETAEEVHVPAGSDLVELRLFGEGLGSFETFDVAIRDQSGATVWENSGLRLEKLDKGQAVVAEVPADRLPAGTYEIQTQGRSLGGEPEELAPLEVKVVWQQ